MHHRFALVQSNAVAGFVDANIARIKALYHIAVTAGAEMVIFPEMAITGYPIEDLALNSEFQHISVQALEALAALTLHSAAMLVGGLWHAEDCVYNAAFLLEGGTIAHRQYKRHLPNYGVFDEKRIFSAGPMPEPFFWRGITIGLLICEDMWLPDVAAHLKQNGAQLLIAINASPFETGKPEQRHAIALQRVQETGLSLLYVNHAGGQDELVFDGGSFALSSQGELCLRLHSFQEDSGIVTVMKGSSVCTTAPGIVHPLPAGEEAIYKAAMLGLKDFVTKNGFTGVVLGMSGGIDSALSATIAADALGKSNVRCVMLPSPVTSRESREDAEACAQRLGIRLETIPIAAGMQGFDAMLASAYEGALPAVIAESNQTRLRAGILMAISHTDRSLLLNTGNKSEMAVGYTTLYGDMCGHYSVLKDMYKTTVYSIARWRNTQGAMIPERILTKPPSAELHAGQTDQDTLPSYEVLDAILSRLVEDNLSASDVIAQGYERATVEAISHMLFAAEYKRRQSCPGVKLSAMSFYRDRRYPLTSAWRGMALAMANPLSV